MHLRSIALGGGGTRGGLHVGALQALLEIKGDLAFPDGIYGASIGAMFATALAFGVELPRIRQMADTYLTVTTIVPELRLDHLLTLPARKGVFPMTALVDKIAVAFLEVGLDLRGKRCSDAKYPLFIAASNMTTAKATLLTGDVLVLDAIRCSACIPVVFEPQVLYGQIYLDAGVFLRSLGSIVPKETLVLHIGTEGPHSITEQSTLSEILWACYTGRAALYKGTNVCRMTGVPYGPLAELTQADRDRMVHEGYSQTHAFLAVKELK